MTVTSSPYHSVLIKSNEMRASRKRHPSNVRLVSFWLRIRHIQEHYVGYDQLSSYCKTVLRATAYYML